MLCRRDGAHEVVLLITPQTLRRSRWLRSKRAQEPTRPTHPLLEKLGAMPAARAEIFAYSVKIVCGKQTETNCCCVAGVRPGVYATEVNIQNLNLLPAPVVKPVLPLINSGAVVAREPNIADPALTRDRRHHTSPAGRDDGRLLPHRGVAAGRAPSGDTGLTIAILTILSLFELSVSAVYTASPLSGDGISIDVEYIPSRRLGLRGPG